MEYDDRIAIGFSHDPEAGDYEWAATYVTGLDGPLRDRIARESERYGSRVSRILRKAGRRTKNDPI